MASIFKRNQIWQISDFSTGKQIVKSLKTRDEKMARFLKKEWEVKLKRGEAKFEKRVLIEEYYKQYLEEIVYRKHSTNVADCSRIRAFLKTHGKKTVNSINYDDIKDYLKLFEEKSPKTYNEVILTLKRFFRLAVEREYILKNPVEGFRHKKVPQALPRFLTDEEYGLLERLSLEEGIYSMVVVARYTGLRLAELLHLEWQDFDWGRKTVRVINKPKYDFTVKNYQSRVVPIGEELRDKLLGYIKTEGLCFPAPDGQPYGHEGPRKRIRNAIDRSGLREGKRMGWHALRHTFASRLAQEGVSLYKISKWMGHADLKTTQIYAHFAPIYDGDIEKLSIRRSVRHSEHESILI